MKSRGDRTRSLLRTVTAMLVMVGFAGCHVRSCEAVGEGKRCGSSSPYFDYCDPKLQLECCMTSWDGSLGCHDPWECYGDVTLGGKCGGSSQCQPPLVCRSLACACPDPHCDDGFVCAPSTTSCSYECCPEPCADGGGCPDRPDGGSGHDGGGGGQADAANGTDAPPEAAPNDAGAD